MVQNIRDDEMPQCYYRVNKARARFKRALLNFINTGLGS